ncbi:Hypothetical predicted protein [Podarcis lilfordi]|uniref:Uncharacterized protein n=1 Tax=Podarcis lilfordi TaxID=74358 RepID=A0AA35K7K7_9SAUR|nr:Hypothetical predicted protein [Podarcis lilfordi]
MDSFWTSWWLEKEAVSIRCALSVVSHASDNNKKVGGSPMVCVFIWKHIAVSFTEFTTKLGKLPLRHAVYQTAILSANHHHHPAVEREYYLQSEKNPVQNPVLFI